MPDWKTLVRERLAPLRLTPSAETDLAEEVAQHLEDTYRDALAGSATPSEAYQLALAELEDVEALRARRRIPRYDPVPAGDTRPANWLNDLWRDLRYAVRSMRRTPVFVAFAVATLALGIGANTTVFTLVNTLILNPLPVRDPGGLTAVAAVPAGDPSKSNATPFPISYRELQDYRTSDAFASLAGYSSARIVTLQQS